MNYCHPSKLPTILIQLRDVGIFEMIEQMKNHMQKDFELNIKLFLEKSQSVLLDSDYEVQVYKKEIEDMKAHCFEIEKRNASFKEKNEFYEYIIDNFINYINISNCIIEQAGRLILKGQKKI
jgi:signal recognition particle GTPase